MLSTAVSSSTDLQWAGAETIFGSAQKQRSHAGAAGGGDHVDGDDVAGGAIRFAYDETSDGGVPEAIGGEFLCLFPNRESAVGDGGSVYGEQGE